MKGIKNIAAVVLSSIMVLSVAGCGKAQIDAPAKAAAPEDKVAAASAKMEEAESMKGVMKMDIKMSADGEAVDTSTESEMFIFNEPIKIKMNSTANVMGTEMPMEYYMIQGDDGKIAMYIGSDDLGWVKQEVDENYVNELKGNSDDYLKYAQGFESAGDEEINGETTEKFVGVIKADDINEVLGSANLESLLGSTGEDASAIKKMFEGVEDIPMTIWISDVSGYPVQFDMDMAQMMQTIMNNAMAEYGETAEGEEVPEITIDNARIIITYSDFNSIEDFEVPANVIEEAVEQQ